MKARTRLSLGLAALVSVAGASGCVSFHGPRALRHDVSRSLSRELKPITGFGLGKGALFLISLAVSDEDVRFHGISRVELGVYEVERRRDHARLGRFTLDGFTTALRVHDGEEEVVVLAREASGPLRELVLVALDGDELALIRLRGKLDATLARMMAANGDDGWVSAVRERHPRRDALE